MVYSDRTERERPPPYASATLTRPTSGTAAVGGCDVMTHSLKVKQQIGVVHQTLNFDPESTGDESLLIHGMLYGMPRSAIRDKMRGLLEFADLVDAAKRKVSTYSGGMKRRLSIASAMMHDPRVFLRTNRPSDSISPCPA